MRLLYAVSTCGTDLSDSKALNHRFETNGGLLGKTGCPLVVNTSFNVRGEPITCTPTDAFKCFMGAELDALAVGNYLLIKEEQDEALKANYEERYELD